MYIYIVICVHHDIYIYIVCTICVFYFVDFEIEDAEAEGGGYTAGYTPPGQFNSRADRSGISGWSFTRDE